MTHESAPPQVSVLLPCYNAQRHLRSCLDSLLTQTYRHFEVIAIDDGSTDDTARMLAEYAARDRRIVFSQNEQNLGLIRTLNLAIVLSRGDYIARMDADDQAVPERFQRQVGFLDAHADVDLVSSSLTLIDVSDRVVGERKVWVTQPAACRYVSFFATPLAHSAVMGRRHCFSAFGYSSRPEALHTEDYELWCRLLRAGKRLANSPEPLLRYRISADSISARYEALQVRNFVTCAERHLREQDGAEAARETVEVLTNRIDFRRAKVPLEEGLRLLQQLTDHAKAGATDVTQAEIAAAATMQRLDILLQCVLKGGFRLRMRAFVRLVTAALPVMRRPRIRNHLRQKIKRPSLLGAG
jgi:GT2 family glycosyltransferase